MKPSSWRWLLKPSWAWLIVPIILAGFLRLWQLPVPQRYLFDEDYFAFTAELMLQGNSLAYAWWLPPFDQNTCEQCYRPPAIEWLHPPVSKLIQAGSLSLVRESSLARRLPSALAGVMVVLLIGYIVHRSANSWLATISLGLLAATEGLLLTQSRIASAEMMLTLGILLLLITQLSYLKTSSLKQAVLLGLVWGVCLATKWSALPLGLVLLGGIVFNPKLSHQSKVLHGLCLVATSAVVYLMSYAQFFLLGYSFSQWWQLQQEIVWYQQTVQFVHPAASRPWEWLIGQKPILLFEGNAAIGQLISSTTLPILLAGWIAILLTIKQWWKKRRVKLAAGIASLYTIAILSAAVGVNRPLFLYHLTPLVPLLFVALGTLKLPKAAWYMLMAVSLGWLGFNLNQWLPLS